MNYPIFDLHCDTASKLIGSRSSDPQALYKNSGHIDLERAGKLPGYCQCFACFTTPFMEEWEHKSPIDLFEKQMEIIVQEIERNHDVIRQAYSSQDIKQNLSEGVMSGVLTIEGPAGFGYNPEMLEYLYLAGFRITTLGWNEKNPLTGSHETGGGLTDLGRAYVKEAQRLGMIVDVSHISDEGFWDIMDITQAPVIASHSNSRAIHPVSRNLTDEMFLEICKTGGVAGLNLYADFLGEQPDLNTACGHILHFLELDPDGNHIALGGDLDGCEQLPNGFCGVQDYPHLIHALEQFEVGEKILQKITWNNALGVMEKCCI